MNKKLEIIYRVLCLSILQSAILVVSFVSLHYSLKILIERDSLSWGVQIGLIHANLGFLYLQIANVFYWAMGINIFNFKKLGKGES